MVMPMERYLLNTNLKDSSEGCWWKIFRYMKSCNCSMKQCHFLQRRLHRNCGWHRHLWYGTSPCFVEENL